MLQGNARSFFKDPPSGCGPLVLISGLGGLPPFHVASMTGPNLKGGDSAVLHLCFLPASVNGNISVDPCYVLCYV